MNLTQHHRFQWMAGMLTKNGPRVLAVYKDDDGEPWLSYAYASPGGYGAGADVKQCRVSEFVREHGELDLDDAATVGCVQQLVLGGLRAGISVEGDRVSMWDLREWKHREFRGTSLGDALYNSLQWLWGN